MSADASADNALPAMFESVKPNNEVGMRYPTKDDDGTKTSELFLFTVRSNVSEDLTKVFGCRNRIYEYKVNYFNKLMYKVDAHPSDHIRRDWGIYNIGHLIVLVNMSKIIGFWVYYGVVCLLDEMNEAYVNGTHYDVSSDDLNLLKFVRSVRNNWLKSDYKIIQDMLNATNDADIEAKVDEFFN
jgi:hypothetical protein